MNDLGSNLAREIQIGSSNFRTEMERYLTNAEGKFKRLSEDLREMLSKIDVKFMGNEK